MSIQCMYKLLGDCDKEMTKNAKHLSWSIKYGSMSSCESCTNEKTKQENGTKSNGTKNTKDNCCMEKRAYELELQRKYGNSNNKYEKAFKSH